MPGRSRIGAISPNPIAGNSKNDGVLLHKGPDGQPEVGLWQCTPGTWPLSIPRDELCYFVSGRATYTHESGETIEIVPGTVDAVSRPAGPAPARSTRPCAMSTC